MARYLSIVLLLVAVLALLAHRVVGEEDMEEPEDPDDPDMMGGGMGGGDGFGDDDMEGEGGGPPPQELQHLKSLADFDTFLDDSDASVIGAFLTEKMDDPTPAKPTDWDDDEDGEWEPPTIDNPALVGFKTVAASAYGFRFAYTTEAKVLERLKSKAGGVYFYRSPRYVSKEHGDRPRERFPGDNVTESAVTHWLETRPLPLVGEYSSKVEDRYQSAVLLIFMDLDFKENAKSVNYVLKRARKVAFELKGKLAIAVASLTDMSYELSDYGLSSKSNGDILMGIRAGPDYTAKKYGAPAGQSFSGDALANFANSYLAGKLTPHESSDSEDDAGDKTADAKDEM
jgi:hypothetical protein